MNAIGLRIKEIRKANNVTQKQFAERIGITRDAIAQIETDKSLPNLETTNNIVKYYHIYLNWLITGEGPMIKPSERVADAGKASDHSVVSDKMVPEIAHLKAELSAKNSQIADLRDHISTLKTQLSECQKRENILLNSVFSDKKTVK